MGRDVGYLGQLVSLAGVKGAQGKGLLITGGEATINAGTPERVLDSNPQRVWALLTNDGAVNVTIIFGDASGDSGTHVLVPNGSLLINEFMRWTGAIVSTCAAGVGTINYTEASVT